MHILIIPGHGGNDPGAKNPRLSDENTEEEDFNLEISLESARILRERGHDVNLSRDRDIYLSPADQLAMIRRMKPDCVIAIHCNASTNEKTHGIETYYRDVYDIELAGAVHDSLVAATGHADRGIHQDVEYLKRRLAVLSDMKTPACLVEVAYITNPEEFAYIEQDHQTIAEAIADGVTTWAS